MSRIFVPLCTLVFCIFLAFPAFSSGPETPCGGQNGPNCHGNDDRGQNGPSGWIISGPDVPEDYVRELFPPPGANGPGEMSIACHYCNSSQEEGKVYIDRGTLFVHERQIFWLYDGKCSLLQSLQRDDAGVYIWSDQIIHTSESN